MAHRKSDALTRKSRHRATIKSGQPRDTYKYELKVGNNLVYRGITVDPERREKEHQLNWPGSRIETIGRRTTRAGALRWEKRGSAPSGQRVRDAARQMINLHRDALAELERR